MKPIKPIILFAEDGRLHKLVALDYELDEYNPCNGCSMYSFCTNHEYDNGDFCLCDAVAHKMGIKFEYGEDLFRFERVEYDKSLQGETLNVMPRFKIAKRYIERPKYIF